MDYKEVLLYFLVTTAGIAIFVPLCKMGIEFQPCHSSVTVLEDENSSVTCAGDAIIEISEVGGKNIATCRCSDD
jgi:hypothetical protein